MEQQTDIAHQLELLHIHRRTLAHLLQQAALYGGESLAPPHVIAGIEQARGEVQRIKAALHALGVVADDVPGDDPVSANAISAAGGAFLARIHGHDAQMALRNRAAMLEKMRLAWIDGVLHQSLYREVRLELGMQTQPDAITLPLRVQVQELGGAIEDLPLGTTMQDMYDRYRGALLILGSPGGGKTTMLLELASALLDRAQRDPLHPIPVVFPLSTWSTRPRPLDEWLRDELHERYDLPRRLAREWLAQEQILPLLDGLDEVAEPQRAACVAAINTFRHDHGLLPLVVSSRIDEYAQLTAGDRRLRLDGAILLQPLTRTEVHTYLTRLPAALDGVRAVLTDDPDHWLWEFVLTPLMLSIISLAYKDTPAEDLRRIGTFEQQRTQLFGAYATAMFQRRVTDQRYDQIQTMSWLSQLARQLITNNQTVFYLEGLQPAWLSTSAQRWRYWLLDRLFGVLVCIISIGLSVGMGIGLSVGLSAMFFGGNTELYPGTPRRLGIQLRDALLGASISVLIFRLVADLIPNTNDGSIFGLILGLGFGVVARLTGRPRARYRTVMSIDTLRWSWRPIPRAIVNGVAFGLIYGCIYMLLARWLTSRGNGLVTQLGNGLIGEVLGGLLGGLIVGMTSGILSGLLSGFSGAAVTNKVRPNQGIRRSFRSALRLGLLGGAVIGLIFGLIFGIGFDRTIGLAVGLIFGLIFGVSLGLVYGGYACLSHVALRLVLWRAGAMPLNYIQFLDYCTERIFLRKVGGGYIFVHRMVMEYFAMREPEHDDGDRGVRARSPWWKGQREELASSKTAGTI